MFMPGIPQVWYLDIFAGKNDYEAADKGGSGRHKEINRTTLSIDDIKEGLKKDVVVNQLKIMQLRNTSKAFLGDLKINESTENTIDIAWSNNRHVAQLRANLQTYDFNIVYTEEGESKTISFSQ